MSNINLSQSSIERKKHELGAIFDKSLVSSLGVLIVAFGTLFGLKMYASALESKAAAMTDALAAQTKDLQGESAVRIVDFSKRLEDIDQKLASKDVTQQDMLALVEKSMVNNVSLSSYQYDIDAKTLSVKLVSNDFKSIAQQVMSFKSVAAFAGVSLKNTLRGDNGAIVSDVVISL